MVVLLQSRVKPTWAIESNDSTTHGYLDTLQPNTLQHTNRIWASSGAALPPNSYILAGNEHYILDHDHVSIVNLINQKKQFHLHTDGLLGGRAGSKDFSKACRREQWGGLRW